jgi:peptidoglycan/xylan/chitin deacetylase (PgdA/CDA1 family)
MLREMAEGGAEIGAHTVTHSILTRLDPAEAEREVGVAARIVTARVGVPCRHFAYPNGKAEDFDADCARIVRDAGLVSATTTIEGLNWTGDDPFTLRRLGIYGHYRMPEFLGMISGFHASLSRLLMRPA